MPDDDINNSLTAYSNYVRVSQNGLIRAQLHAAQDEVEYLLCRLTERTYTQSVDTKCFCDIHQVWQLVLRFRCDWQVFKHHILTQVYTLRWQLSRSSELVNLAVAKFTNHENIIYERQLQKTDYHVTDETIHKNECHLIEKIKSQNNFLDIKDRTIQQLNQDIEILRKNNYSVKEQVKVFERRLTELAYLERTIRQLSIFIVKDIDEKFLSTSTENLPVLVRCSQLTNLNQQREDSDISINEEICNELITAIRSKFDSHHVREHELFVKINEMNSSLDNWRRRCEDCASNHEQLKLLIDASQITEKELKDVISKLESELHEKEEQLTSGLKNYDETLQTFQQLEVRANTLSEEIACLSTELRKANIDKDILKEANIKLVDETKIYSSRLNDFKQQCIEKDSRLEELNTNIIRANETVKQNLIDLEIIGKENSDLHDTLATYKLDKEELIGQLSRLNAAESTLRSILTRLVNQNEDLFVDKTDLNQLIEQLTFQQDRLRTEKGDLDKKLTYMSENIRLLTSERDSALSDLVKYKDRVELTENELCETSEKLRANKLEHEDTDIKFIKLEREKERLYDNFISSKMERDQANIELERVVEQKENLARTNGELLARCESYKTEMITQRDQLASLRTSCLHLEMELATAKNKADSFEFRLKKSDGDLITVTRDKDDLRVELESTKRALTNDLDKLMWDKSELKQLLDKCILEKQNLVAAHENKYQNMVVDLNREKEKAVNELETRLRKCEQNWTLEQDDLISQKEDIISKLHTEIERLNKMHEIQLLSVEDSKQKTLSLAFNEQKSLQNCLREAKQECCDLKTELRRINFENSSNVQSSSNAISDLKIENQRLEDRLVKIENTHKHEVKNYNSQIEDYKKMRDVSELTIAQMRNQLLICDERLNSIRSELNDKSSIICQMQIRLEKSEDSILQSKQYIQEITAARDLLDTTNASLRENIKQCESNAAQFRIQLDQSNERCHELQTAIVSLEACFQQSKTELNEGEHTRSNLSRDLTDVTRELHTIDSQYKDTLLELSALQIQIVNEKEKGDAESRENEKLRTDVVELEVKCDNLEKHNKSLEFKLEETNGKIEKLHREIKLTDEEHEGFVKHMEQENTELQAKLSNISEQEHEAKLNYMKTCGRAEALEKQISYLDSVRIDLNAKLFVISMALFQATDFKIQGIKTTGIDTDGKDVTFNLEQNTSRTISVTIDSVLLRHSLDTYIRNIAEIKYRAEDVYKRLAVSQRELKCLTSQLEECQRRFDSCTETLKSTVAERDVLAQNLKSKDAELKTLGDLHRQLKLESACATDKLIRTEDVVSEHQDSIRKLEERLGVMRKQERFLQTEKCDIREKLEQQEKNLLQLETSKRAVEADLSRCQSVLKENVEHAEALESRIELLQKHSNLSEQRVEDAEANINLLTQKLNSSDIERNSLKSSLFQQKERLAQQASQLSDYEDRIRQIEAACREKEFECNMLTEKVSNFQDLSEEMKRQNAELIDKMCDSQRQLNEEKLRSSQFNLQLQAMESERSRLIVNDDIQGHNKDMQHLISENMFLKERMSQLQSEHSRLLASNAHLETDCASAKLELRRRDDISARQTVQLPYHMNDVTSETVGVTSSTSTVTSKNQEIKSQVKPKDSVAPISSGQNSFVSSIYYPIDQNYASSDQFISTRPDIQENSESMFQNELDMLKTKYVQLERNIEARERNFRQREVGLKEQVVSLKQQLADELRRRYMRGPSSAHSNADIRAIRQLLDVTQTSDANTVDHILRDSGHSKVSTSRSRTISPRRISTKYTRKKKTSPVPDNLFN